MAGIKICPTPAFAARSNTASRVGIKFRQVNMCMSINELHKKVVLITWENYGAFTRATAFRLHTGIPIKPNPFHP
jgi:hypothetical protein